MSYNGEIMQMETKFAAMSDLFFSTDSSPTRSDAVKNRALLLDTARRLFEKLGVESVSMSQIAEAAGVGKGTLYRHFNNKAEISYALLDDEQRELQAATFARLRSVSDACDNLCWFLENALRFVTRNIDLLYGGLDGSHETALNFEAHHWWRQTIRALLQRMQVQGDLDYFADLLYVMLNVEAVHYQLRVRGYPFERINSGLQDTLQRLSNS